MKYLLYARVSPKGSGYDGGETSIPVQLAECRDFILRRDPAAEFIEISDELKSGKNLDRAGMRRIIAEMESPRCEWDCLVVWHLDRFSRSIADAAPLLKKLSDAGKGIMSVRQNIDMFSAGGRFMINVFLSAAQYEREMTSERTTMKMKSIAKAGKIPYGKIPIGYKRVDDNTLVIDPIGASIVKDIFRAYSEDIGNNEVFSRYRDRIKSKNTLYNILRNRLYIGEIEYSGETHKGEHTPIIEREIFDAVQKMLPGRHYNAPRPNAQKYKYLLSGLIKCHCNRHMTNHSVLKKGIRFPYYKCTDSVCGNAINAQNLDETILDKILEIAKSPDFIKNAVDEYEQHQLEIDASVEPEIIELEKQIAIAVQAEEKSAAMFTSGLVTKDNMMYWNQKLSESVKTREDLTSRVNSLKSRLREKRQNLLPDIMSAAAGWAKIIQRIDDDNPEGDILKRNLVLSLVQDIKSTAKGAFNLNMVMSKCLNWYPGEESNLRPKV